MIYLDNNATAPLLPGVLDAMLPLLREGFGNPSSRHPLGESARQALEEARAEFASFLGVPPCEVVFTSCGTESVALAFQCALSTGARTAVVSAVEHSCVLEAARCWQSRGYKVEIVPVGRDGIPEMDALQRVLRASGPAFVSMIWANNETGVVSPAGAIAEICRANGALLHLDAVQAPMHIDVDAGAAACDYLSLSAHKFHGPKGVGILAAKSLAPRAPLLPGHQESGMRGGTENLPAIVGAAAALALQPDWRREAARQARLRDALERGILETIPGTAVNGAPTQRIGNTTSIFFPGRNAADMVAALGRAGLCVSAGAACSTGGRPSHVLQAMGYGEQRANGSIRFSLGRENTEAEVARALEIVRTVYASGLVAWGEQ